MSSDVLVIGGGPAGLAAAIALRQRGFAVQVADPCLGSHAATPIDKCCGEGLLPPAVHALGLLGIPAGLLRQHGHDLEGIRFIHGGASATARFPSFGSPALGVRRTVLHQLLRNRAHEIGVRLLPSTARLLQVRENSCRALVGSCEQEVRWVVGADGAQSAVRASAGLEASTWATRSKSQRFAIRQHFQLGAGSRPPHLVAVHWGRGTQAYVTPVDGNTVGVAVIARKPLASMEAAIAHFPALQTQLEGAESVSRARGAVTSHRTLRSVACQSVALVGDASGSVDAITGDGLALTFAQSLALAEALAFGDLALYRRAHRRLGRTARLMSRALVTMGCAATLTRSSMFLLERVPGFFPALLGLHTRPGLATVRGRGF